MFKKKILTLKTNRLIRQHKKKSIPPRPLPEKGEVGILCTSNQKQNFEHILKLKDIFKNDGMEVTMLCFAIKGDRTTSIPFDFYEETDFSNWGKILSGNVENFIGKDFSYLFYLDNSFYPFTEYVLASSKALCRFGINHTDEKNDLFHVTIQTKNNDWREITEEIYRYKKMMHNYERAV